MSCLAHFTPLFKSTKRISQGAVSSESQRQRYVSLSSLCLFASRANLAHEGNSSYTTSIHVLDDDSLLNIFHLYRVFPLGGSRDIHTRLGGGMDWVGERWWYILAHVCQRWRNLILGSATYLGLCLVCTYGTPVADMLTHSPPLPLVIDYRGPTCIAEDEEAIILALAQRDRVRRIRFVIPVLCLQKLIQLIDGEYPILEYLILADRSTVKSTLLALPETLEIPRLRHLTINGSIPIRLQLLTTAVTSLVTLHLALHHLSTYFQPNVLLQSLSLMPQLEVLLIKFCFAVPNRDVERQLMRTPMAVTHVTLPNLRFFEIEAGSIYSEAVLGRITASHLENLLIFYPNEFTFSVPELVQFIGRTAKLRFNRTWIKFDSDQVYVNVFPHEPETTATVAAFAMGILCWHLDWQVSSVAQIFNAISQISSAVEHLTLAHEYHSLSSEEHNEVDRTEWRKLLRSFNNVKTLHVRDGLIRDLTHCLRLEDGEDSLELLPELQKLTYPARDNANDEFTSFIDARQNAGRPVTLIKSQY